MTAPRFSAHVTALAAALALFLPTALDAQQRQFQQGPPHVGYVYPAGARQGETVEITLGGQSLNDPAAVQISGEGLHATVGKYHRPLNPGEATRIRDKLEEARKKIEGDKAPQMPEQGFRNSANFRKIMQEAGITEEQMRDMAEMRRRMNDPKHPLVPAIAETVVVKVALAADAPPGKRELRLLSAGGLSNPVVFYVGTWPECRESEPNDKTPDTAVRTLPAVINGQVMPGDVDRFAFEARQGARLVIASSARDLVPYIADAVPGWFQAALTLYDPQGNEMVYAEALAGQPDPAFCCTIPKDGRYVLEIKDAIYRGREDFVYRITLGEMPWMQGVFPLGGRQGDPIAVQPHGWNLPPGQITLDLHDRGPGIQAVTVQAADHTVQEITFDLDTLPECLEQEPNSRPEEAQAITLPMIVNGRIDAPGDWDVFRFEGRAGEQLVAETQARRLGSPLDSLLRLTDAGGRQLAINDDHEDPSAGLTAHQADSRLDISLPADGTYFLHVGDAQNRGGPAYAYRLRIGPPQPDFALRVVPASVSANAGTTVPIAVYALRRDGFSGEIGLSLKDPPPGFKLSGGRIPAGQDQVRLTLTVPFSRGQQVIPLRLEGRALLDGRLAQRVAMPAEDMLQAFAYHHLVPAKQWVAAVTSGPWRGGPVKLMDDSTLRIVRGGTAEIRFSLPVLPAEIKLHLELSEPPEGIALGTSRSTQDGMAVQLTADADKAQAGLKGNLIVEAFAQRSPPAGTQPPRAANFRMKIGTFPAVPFEIVGR